MNRHEGRLSSVIGVLWVIACGHLAICAYGADTPSGSESEYKLRILSVITTRYLKHQYVEGGERVGMGMMVRGGKLITERVKPQKGIFILLHIEATYLGLGAEANTSPTGGDPWKAASRAFERYKDVKPLVCDMNNTFLVDSRGQQYSTRGCLRVEDDDYFVGMVAQDKKTSSDILRVYQHGPGEFWLYFDVPRDATSFELIPSAGFTAMKLPPAKDKQFEDFRGLFPDMVDATLDDVRAKLKVKPQLASIKSKRGSPPLNIAANWSYTEMVEILLSAGADPNSADTNGDTPLHIAAIRGNSDVVDMLLVRGAHYDVGNIDGTTPLHYAVINGHAEVTLSLLQKGANVNAQNKQGVTPLHNSTSEANLGLTELLLKFGADANMKSDKGITPLHNAASVGSKEIVQLLIKHKANVNAAETTGHTPLHCAVGLMDENLSKDVAKVLLDSGANPNIKAGDGKSPLDVALQLGHDEVAGLLRTKVEDAKGSK